jgi:hypothetical protein
MDEPSNKTLCGIFGFIDGINLIKIRLVSKKWKNLIEIEMFSKKKIPSLNRFLTEKYPLKNSYDAMLLKNNYTYLKIQNENKIFNKCLSDKHGFPMDKLLIAFAENGHLDAVKILLTNGANIHYQNDSALIKSVSNGKFYVVEFLLKKGANIHVNNDEVLKISVQMKHVPMIKLLLKKGANLDSCDMKTLKFIIKLIQ